MVYAQGQKTYTLAKYEDGLLTKDLRKSRIHEERLTPMYTYTASVIQPGFRRRSKTFTRVEDALTWLTHALPLFRSDVHQKSRSKVFDADAHRSIVLSVADAPIRKTAHKRAHMILSQTGSFVRAIGSEDLTSREAFAKALRAARNSKKVKTYQTSSAPSEGNPSIWGSFEPTSAEAKPSLRISIPNDAPEDVAAEVLADLSCQSSPCSECGRLFPLDTFFAVADKVVKTDEQRAALRNLRNLAGTNRLVKACPMLFHALGIPPNGKYKSGEKKDQYILPQKGPLAEDADTYHCRMHQLAGHYCWRAAMRYAYRAARGGAFREGLRQTNEGYAEEYECDTPIWASAEGVPDEEVIRRLTSDANFTLMTLRIRLSAERELTADRMLKVLDLVRKTTTWPTGEEVGDLLGLSERSGRVYLADLADVMREVIAA